MNQVQKSLSKQFGAKLSKTLSKMIIATTVRNTKAVQNIVIDQNCEKVIKNILCLGVACGMLENDFFERFCGCSCAMLGSTVDTCSATVRFGRIHTNFDVHVDSNPVVFFFVVTQNGVLCSVDASGTLKSGILCTSCTWLAVWTMKDWG